MQLAVDTFRHWGRAQFRKYKGCVASLQSRDLKGDLSVGTCFHVGDGVFVTTRHVVEGRFELKMEFDDDATSIELIQTVIPHIKAEPAGVKIISGPYCHPDPQVDVACFKTDFALKEFMPLGGHLDDYLSQYEFILHRVLVLGYPPIPLTNRAALVANVGEVNAAVELYVQDQKRVHFLVSTMARGGFSGGPVLIAYNELNEESGTAVLGVVTQSLVANYAPAESGHMAVLSVDPIYECLEAASLLPQCQSSITAIHNEMNDFPW